MYKHDLYGIVHSAISLILALVLVIGLMPLPSAQAIDSDKNNTISSEVVDIPKDGNANDSEIDNLVIEGDTQGEEEPSIADMSVNTDIVVVPESTSQTQENSDLYSISENTATDNENSIIIEDHEQLYSYRLLVGFDGDITPRNNDTVLGVYDDVALLGFESALDMSVGKAYYTAYAEYATVDGTIGIASSDNVESFASARDTVPVGEGNNSLALLSAMNRVNNNAENETKQLNVALIDTGTHEQENVAIRESIIGEQLDDDNGHGTFMLDTMRAQNNNMRIFSIKALDEYGKGSVSSVYAGIKRAVELKADIINLSLSARSSENNAAIADAIADATTAGITVVAAAGNGGYNANEFTPGNINDVLTIGSSVDGKISPNSNSGACVDGYVESSSTSEATAVVSGILSSGISFDEALHQQKILQLASDNEVLSNDSEQVGTDFSAASTIYYKVYNHEIDGLDTYRTLYLRGSSASGYSSTNGVFSSTSDVAWSSGIFNLAEVIIETDIYPTSTAYWFSEMATSQTSGQIYASPFSAFTGLSHIKSTYWTNASYMFDDCKVTRNFASGGTTTPALDLSSLDVSNVTNMEHMLAHLDVTELNVSGWNTSKVTNMYGMFWEDMDLMELDLSSWNTSSVTNMSCMFLWSGLSTIYASSVS